ncbi:MAG: T9SS type A sorting domain-containing protein [Bacteroidota bacterium]
MKTLLIFTLMLAALTATAQITNSNPQLSQSSTERDEIFGKVIGDSIINDPDSLDFKYNNKETFYKAAKAEDILLHLGTANDAKYQQEFESLSQSNIGKYDEVKEHLQNEEQLLALQKLAVIVDENLKEQNLKTVNSIIALLYNPAMDADSDTVAILNVIAYMHPFYGGEAVYWSRAILHLDVEDELPQLRRPQHQQNGSEISSLHGKLFPIPANESVTFRYEHDEDVKISFTVTNALGQVLSICRLAENEINFSTASLPPGIYYLKVFENNVMKEDHKLTIIR